MAGDKKAVQSKGPISDLKIEVLRGVDRIPVQATANPYSQVHALVAQHGGRSVEVNTQPAEDWLKENETPVARAISRVKKRVRAAAKKK